MPGKYDFGGYATKNDLKCSDGRTIRKDAFKDCDGLEVPLVWGHKHGSPGDVLGHAVLENREDGVYTYGTFNETESGKNAKELVKHGDVKALSIYANQLVQKGGDVLHGMIREVSLCLAGANPGAMIQELSIEHSDDDDTEIMEALIFNGNNIALEHADEKKEEEPAKEAKEEKPMAEEAKKNENEKTVQDVWDSLTEEQKNVVYYMIGQALEDKDDDKEDVKHSDDENNEEDTTMAHNVFEGDTATNSLSHAEIAQTFASIVKEARDNKSSSLKDYIQHSMEENEALAHATDSNGMTVPDVNNATYKNTVGYGINGVEYLYPEARTLNNTPEFIGRRMDWVNVVLNGVHKSPFARVKSVFANITEDEARAKGYIKGTQKKNEFFSLMKRVTNPQTIYKKQKIDRDDVIDITDLNVVAWIRGEMDMMLDEEKARAILIGDGRDVSDADKINETNIRPIVSDADLFTIKVTVNRGATDEETGKAAVKAALRSRKNYRGSGNTIMFAADGWATEMLLAEDQIGRRRYSTEAELAAALRVRSVVSTPVLENYTNASGDELIGIIVDLSDYNVGADRGGAKEMFDDFDIDFNRYVYLLETRCSGALTKPYSAIALFAKNGGSTTT